MKIAIAVALLLFGGCSSAWFPEPHPRPTPPPPICEHRRPPEGCVWVGVPSGDCAEDRLECNGDASTVTPPKGVPLVWNELHDQGWLIVYRSDDGRWQIEPAQNNEGERSDDDWALIDRRHDADGWVSIGTLCEMKNDAARLAHAEVDADAADDEEEARRHEVKR